MADKTPKNNTPCRRLGLRRSIPKITPTELSSKFHPNNVEDTPKTSMPRQVSFVYAHSYKILPEFPSGN